MNALDNLIRLHRWQLDERRRQLGELELLAVKLKQEQDRLQVEEQVEQGVAGSAYEASWTFGGYARELAERRRRLAQSLTEVEQQIAIAREALSEVSQEVKRYEITAASRQRMQRQRLDQRQRRALDDVAIEGYRRRRAGNE
jgi:flagellar FliJ protein